MCTHNEKVNLGQYYLYVFTVNPNKRRKIKYSVNIIFMRLTLF